MFQSLNCVYAHLRMPCLLKRMRRGLFTLSIVPLFLQTILISQQSFHLLLLRFSERSLPASFTSRMSKLLLLDSLPQQNSSFSSIHHKFHLIFFTSFLRFCVMSAALRNSKLLKVQRHIWFSWIKAELRNVNFFTRS